MTAGGQRAQKRDEPPRVISPDERRRLQVRYAQAQSLMARSEYDFREVHQLLARCLEVDPGNLRYIDLLLLNLKRRQEAGTQAGLFARWIGATPLGAHAAAERALAGEEWSAAMRFALEALWGRGLEAATLGLAADACAGMQLGPAELRYRQAAVEASPGAAEPVRRMARSLARWGQFEAAAEMWRRLLELLPGDAEAAAELSESHPVKSDPKLAELEGRIAANPADIDAVLELAAARLAEGDFEAGQRLLTQASAVGGGDLRIREAWERLSLAQSEHRLRTARQRAERDGTAEAMRLVESLVDEHERLALGIAHSRAERFPGDGTLKLDLGRKLKQSGNFSGAAQRFEELRLIPGFEQVALVELGECWQHLRQFGKALDFYRAAIEWPPKEEDRKIRQLALYRGAILAEATGSPDEACEWLERLLDAAGDFKDARERLDKLRPICDKNGFSAG